METKTATQSSPACSRRVVSVCMAAWLGCALGEYLVAGMLTVDTLGHSLLAGLLLALLQSLAASLALVFALGPRRTQSMLRQELSDHVPFWLYGACWWPLLLLLHYLVLLQVFK